MNKFCIKVASICLSAAMLASVFPCSGISGDLFINNNVVSAEEAAANASLIKDGTFDKGVSRWGTYFASGGEGEVNYKDGQLAFDVTALGKLNYGVQLFYDIIPLYKNGVYRLRFDISCDTDRMVEAMIQQNGGTYQSYIWKALNLTSEPQPVDVTFTMEYDTDMFSKLCFNCGNQKEELDPHTIYLDNISLELVDDSDVDYTGFIKDEPAILTNQVGYLPDSKKIAVFRGEEVGEKFSVVDADTDKTVYTGNITGKTINNEGDETDWYGDFSSVVTPGNYYIVADGIKGEHILNKSYPFAINDNAYQKLLDESVRMLYLQRCGCEVVDDNAGHDACHTTEATIYGTKDKIDVSGGWHDAGDYGRYIVPAAKTIADLLLAYEKAPSLYGDATGIPESGNKIPDILDEARYELEWMLKMQDKTTGGVYHKVSCAEFPAYVMPDKEVAELIVTPVSTTSTADFCASMAMAYEWYLDIDKEFADKCLDAAKSAWDFLEKNPDFIFENPKGIVTGEYGDKSDRDERYWAAAQMYRATGDKKYADEFEKMASKYIQTGMDWSTVGDYGSIAYLTMDASKLYSQKNALMTKQDLYDNIKAVVLEEADDMVATAKESAYGTAISQYNWGSNMTIANSGALLYFADELDNTKNYADIANEQFHYLMGKNACGTSFVTGFGTVAPEHPHHRPSMNTKLPVAGMLVGGVNSNLEDSAAKALLEDAAPSKCFIDNAESYSTNEITIYWNSPFVYLMSEILNDYSKEPTVPPVKIVYGDIDSNGKIESTDLTYLSLYMLNDYSFTEEQKVVADVTGDGKINLADVAHLKQYICKDDIKLGPQTN